VVNEYSLLGWLTLAVLFLTGAVVTWYTVETWRLRREAQLQTELQTRPFLSVATSGRSVVYLTNLGRGLARNITIDLVRIETAFELRSPLITHLGAGEDAMPKWRVSSRVLVGGEMSEHTGEDHGTLAAQILTTPAYSYSMTLTYSSIVGQRYRTSFAVRRGAQEIEVTADERLR